MAKILKYSYLGFAHIFGAQGLKNFQDQIYADKYYNFWNLYGIGPNIGEWRCWFFVSLFDSFHWIHATFFTTEWVFWFITE